MDSNSNSHSNSNVVNQESAEPKGGQHDTLSASSSSTSSAFEEQTNSEHDTGSACFHPSTSSGPLAASAAAPLQEMVDKLRSDNARLMSDNTRLFNDNSQLIHNNMVLHHTNAVRRHNMMVLENDNEALVAIVQEEQEGMLATRQHELRFRVRSRVEIDHLRQDNESLRSEIVELQQENENLRTALREQIPKTSVDRIRSRDDDNNGRPIEEANAPSVPLIHSAVPQILAGSGSRRRTARPVEVDEGEQPRDAKRTRP